MLSREIDMHYDCFLKKNVDIVFGVLRRISNISAIQRRCALRLTPNIKNEVSVHFRVSFHASGVY